METVFDHPELRLVGFVYNTFAFLTATPGDINFSESHVDGGAVEDASVLARY